MREWKVRTARGHDIFVRDLDGEWSARVPVFGATYYRVAAPHPDHWPVAIGETLHLIPVDGMSPSDPLYPPGGVIALQDVTVWVQLY